MWAKAAVTVSFTCCYAISFVFPMPWKAARSHSLSSTHLFLSSSVPSLQDPELGVNKLFQIVTLLGLTPARIVLEITEHERIDDWDEFPGTLREYRRMGFHVAVDDLGPDIVP